MNAILNVLRRIKKGRFQSAQCCLDHLPFILNYQLQYNVWIIEAVELLVNEKNGRGIVRLREDEKVLFIRLLLSIYPLCSVLVVASSKNFRRWINNIDIFEFIDHDDTIITRNCVVTCNTLNENVLARKWDIVVCDSIGLNVKIKEISKTASVCVVFGEKLQSLNIVYAELFPGDIFEKTCKYYRHVIVDFLNEITIRRQ